MSLLKSFKKLVSGNTLYYQDDFTKFKLTKISENYIKLLDILKEDFIVLSERFNSGRIPFELGYKTLSEDLKTDNLKIINSNNVKRIISNSPYDIFYFNNEYGIESSHVIDVLFENIEQLDNFQEGQVTYIDSLDLIKLNLTEKPRDILRALGLEVKELVKPDNNYFSSGIDGGLFLSNPDIASKLVKKLFKYVKTENLVVSCPMMYYHLKKNAPENIKVYELSEVFFKKL